MDVFSDESTGNIGAYKIQKFLPRASFFSEWKYLIFKAQEGIPENATLL